MQLRPMSQEDYLQLLRTAKNQMPATMWIKNGLILDVFMKEWRQAHIVIAGERIAYVGEREPLIDESTEILDAEGMYLVPGYVEPHAHPFQWYNPYSLSDYALARGTTTLVSDTLFLFSSLPVDDVEKMMEQLSTHPVKQLFWARLDPQSQKQEMKALFSKERLTRMLSHPSVIQAGELTDWGGILAEQEELLHGLLTASELGKRIEGHHPGASWDTLNIAAAAGVTACHESISIDEVINRLRLGMYASLRHSSIRPDLPELIQGIKEREMNWSSRLMLTSDGSTPPMMREGFIDFCIRVCIESGAPAEEAYVMATLNPATYYGLDAQIGSIAPGRLADILLLESPGNPTPVKVIANGKLWASKQKLLEQPMKSDLVAFSFELKQNQWLTETTDKWFELDHQGGPIPVITMLNAVITKLQEEELPCSANGHVTIEHDPELAYVCLLDTRNKRITKGILRGFGQNIDAIASSYTASADWIVLGRNQSAMARAIQHINQLNGGIVMYDQGEVVFELPLPIAGMMNESSVEELIVKGEEFCQLVRAKGHQHIDPIYSLLFLTATHLPFARLTDEGIYDVKQRKIVVSSTTI